MHQVNWLKDAVFYNIYPQSFYDTNADKITLEPVSFAIVRL